MSKQNVNVLVRLINALDPVRRSSLMQTLGRLAGVKNAAVSHRNERLLLVDYDPSATSAQRILATVRGRGIDARLIGL